MTNYPYTLFSRYGETPSTNPKELLGAAHAACFTMSFVRMLGRANVVPEWLDSKSNVVIEKDADGFSITSVHFTVTARIPGRWRSASSPRSVRNRKYSPLLDKAGKQKAAELAKLF